MGIMGSLIPVEYIFRINGFCCIPQSIDKIKNFIAWVSMPPSERKFLFCAYVITRDDRDGKVHKVFLATVFLTNAHDASAPRDCEQYFSSITGEGKH